MNKTMRWMTVGAMAAVLATGAFAGHHENTELMKELRAFGDRVAKAMAAEDMDAMLAMYVDDAISLPNNGPRMQGLDQFRAQHEEMTASGMKIVAFDSEPTEAWEFDGHVVEIGTYRIELEIPGMGEMEDVGKYMNLYVRQEDGSLKVKAEIWNTDLNPMMGEAGGSEGHDDHDHDHDDHDHDDHDHDHDH